LEEISRVAKRFSCTEKAEARKPETPTAVLVFLFNEHHDRSVIVIILYEIDSL
jgi:hypothetical protein